MSKNNWLIKSGSRILGPYSTEEVKEQLSSRQLVPLDEIVSPNNQWQYIRDHKDFRSIVEQILIEQMELAEHTLTSTIPIDATMTDIEYLKDEATPSVQPNSKPIGQAPTQSYAYKGDRNIQSKTGLFFKLFKVITLTLFLLCTSFFTYKYLIEAPAKKREIVLGHQDQALKSLNIGDYDKALESFDSAYLIDSSSLSSLDTYALLKARAGETSTAQRLLKESGLKSETEKYKLIEAMIYTMEQDYAAATKIYQALIKEKKYSYPSILNLAFIYTKQNQWSQASIHLTNYTKLINEHSFIAYYLAQINTELWKKDQKTNYIIQAQYNLRDGIFASDAYYQESLILQSYFASILGAKTEQVDLMQQALDFDFNQSSLVKGNIYVIPDVYSSRNIASYCRDMLSQAEQNGLNTAMASLCTYKKGELSDALKLSQQSVQLSPNQSQYLALSSFMNLQSDNLSKAHTESGKASQVSSLNDISSAIMRARLCEQKENFECAYDSWLSLYEINDQFLFSLSGLVNYYISKGEWDTARKYLKKGLKVNPNYKLFIEFGLVLNQVKGS